MATYAEQLLEVQEAISAVLKHGQAHDVSGRRLTRADLPALERREERLELKVARESRGGIRMSQAVPRG